MFSRTGSYPLENLSKENRWVKLADALDWTHIEEEYNKRLSNLSRGACNKPARMVIGAMIIKHTLCCSDEGTIVGIQENPYMQYLVGLKYFQEDPVFSPELFVTLRKRIDDKFFNDIMLSMHKDCIKSLVRLNPGIRTKVIQEPPGTVIRLSLLRLPTRVK